MLSRPALAREDRSHTHSLSAERSPDMQAHVVHGRDVRKQPSRGRHTRSPDPPRATPSSSGSPTPAHPPTPAATCTNPASRNRASKRCTVRGPQPNSTSSWSVRAPYCSHTHRKTSRSRARNALARHRPRARRHTTPRHPRTRTPSGPPDPGPFLAPVLVRTARPAIRRPVPEHAHESALPCFGARRYHPSPRLTNRDVLPRYKCADTRLALTPNASAISFGREPGCSAKNTATSSWEIWPDAASPSKVARAARKRSRSASNPSCSESFSSNDFKRSSISATTPREAVPRTPRERSDHKKRTSKHDQQHDDKHSDITRQSCCQETGPRHISCGGMAGKRAARDPDIPAFTAPHTHNNNTNRRRRPKTFFDPSTLLLLLLSLSDNTPHHHQPPACPTTNPPSRSLTTTLYQNSGS